MMVEEKQEGGRILPPPPPGKIGLSTTRESFTYHRQLTNRILFII